VTLQLGIRHIASWPVGYLRRHNVIHIEVKWIENSMCNLWIGGASANSNRVSSWRQMKPALTARRQITVGASKW
jgi:hypothetical protein